MNDELEDEVRELKREIVESRGLIIKTNNLTSSLAADLKSIAKRQINYERRVSWNSATAYIVFVLVVLFCVKILWDNRRENLTTSTTTPKNDTTDALRQQVKELERREDARSRLDLKAQALYELAKNNKRSEFLDQFDRATREGLPRIAQLVFQDTAEKFRSELALERYALGREHSRFARWQEAAMAFEDAIKIKSDATTTPETRLALAQAYRKLNRAREAIPMLQTLSETSSDRDVQASSTWELAQAEIEIQAWNDAKATLRAFIKKFHDHARIGDARIQLNELVLRH